MTKSLPCPFCGGDKIVLTDSFFEPKTWQIYCLDCGATFQRFERFNSEEEAITTWNTRIPNIAQYFAKELKSRCVKGGIYPAFVEATANQILKEIEENKI